ncbi:hypothetical protein [Xanthovirga aplysinae]|uniref:hypothetical protein n=1 Tax=Xanthovirga aplysinae TaxID=2529853 RepID=UPI0012BB8CBF|nr:hypothetical protein [Xanthovirga aplysinae]MTI29782.1 hypothetical protein [Xanthovirga aplysinae]
MKKTIELLLIGALLSSCIYSLIFTSVTDYVVDFQSYLGFALILLTSIIRFKNIKTSTYFLGFSLFLGTFNLIKFSHTSFEFSFFIAGSKVLGFNQIIVILFLIFLSVNGHVIKKILGEGKESTELEKQQMTEKETETFMKKFSNKSIIELQEIIDNPASYVTGAVMASKKLIEEKKKGL